LVNQQNLSDSTAEVITNVYDGLNRLISKTETDPNSATTGIAPRSHVYAYDSNGNLLMEELDSGGAVIVHDEYIYDALNRQTEARHYDMSSAPAPRSTLYGNAYYNRTLTNYDVAGNILSITDEAGRVTQYKYDALNRQTDEQHFTTTNSTVLSETK